MAKKLSCWLGRHEWTTQVEHGETSTVCSACGKYQRRGKLGGKEGLFLDEDHGVEDVLKKGPGGGRPGSGG